MTITEQLLSGETTREGQHRFYVTGGALPADAPSYVTRKADATLYDSLIRGEFCYVLDTRQVGKSSLLIRTAKRLQSDGAAVIAFDLSAQGHNLTVEQWYAGLLYNLAVPLGAEEELEAFWERRLGIGPAQRWFQAVYQLLTERPELRLFLFFDEIDAVRRLSFSTDEFFAGIRGCHERRNYDSIWQRLTVCLAGAATPAQLIEDVRSTPFNIGVRVDLTDFSEDEALPLTHGFAARERTQRQQALRRVLYWTNGQPYLTQCLCAATAPTTAPQTQIDRLCKELFLARANRESDKNLTFVSDRILRGSEDRVAVLALYARIWRSRRGFPFENDDPAATTLRLSGVVTVYNGVLFVRNRLYRRIFDSRWVAENLPDAERRRQRRATRIFFARAAVAWSVLLLSLLGGVWQWRVALGKTNDALNAQKQTVKLQNDFKAQQEELLARTNKAVAAGNAKIFHLSEQIAKENKEFDRQSAKVGDEIDRKTAKVNQLNADFRKTQKRLGEEQENVREAKRKAEASQSEVMQAKRQLAKEIGRTKGIVATSLAQNRGNEFAALQSGLEAVAPAMKLGLDPDSQSMQGLADAANVGLIRRLHIKHSFPLTSVDMSWDGSRLLTAGKSPLAYIRDASDGRLLQTLQALRGERANRRIDAVKFSPDGKWIATGSVEGEYRLWKADVPGKHQTKPFRVLPLRGLLPVGALAFFPDNRHLIVAGPNEGTTVNQKYTAYIWDTQTDVRPRALLGWHDNYLWSVAVSEDGNFVATAGADGAIKVWDAATGKMRAENRDFAKPPGGNRKLEDYAALSVYFIEDKLLCTGKDPFCFTWIWERGNKNDAIYHTYRRHAEAVWSGSGFLEYGVTGSSDGTFCVWSLGREAAPIFQVATHSGAVNEVKLLPHRYEIVTAGGDGVCEVWRITPLSDFTTGGKMIYAECSPADTSNKSRLWVGEESIIWADVRERHTAFTIWLLGRKVFRAAYSPDGKLIATADNAGRLLLWDISGDSANLHEEDARHLRDKMPGLNSVAFTKDGKRIITGGLWGAVWIYDVASGKEVRAFYTPRYFDKEASPVYQNIPAVIMNVNPTPDGRFVAAACRDGAVRLWNIMAGGEATIFTPPGIKPEFTNPTYPTWAEFSPDGNYLAAAYSNGSAYLWDWKRRILLAEMRDHTGKVNCLAFSPDGKTVATGGDDRTAKFWRVADALNIVPKGAPIAPYLTIRAHAARVNSVRFSPNGEEIITAGDDGTARFFPATARAYVNRAYELLKLPNNADTKNDKAARNYITGKNASDKITLTQQRKIASDDAHRKP